MDGIPQPGGARPLSGHPKSTTWGTTSPPLSLPLVRKHYRLSLLSLTLSNQISDFPPKTSKIIFSFSFPILSKDSRCINEPT